MSLDLQLYFHIHFEHYYVQLEATTDILFAFRLQLGEELHMLVLQLVEKLLFSYSCCRKATADQTGF
jgi:hypothetical protein